MFLPIGVPHRTNQLGVLLAIACSARALTIPARNDSVVLPKGATNHGDPNLLCIPTRWYDIVVFFLGNYVAHIATVKFYPGETAFYVAVTSIVVLLSPSAGIIRGLNAIVRHAKFADTPLQVAARAGALCHVVRIPGWEPAAGDVVRDVKIGAFLVFVSTCGSLTYRWVKVQGTRPVGTEIELNSPNELAIEVYSPTWTYDRSRFWFYLDSTETPGWKGRAIHGHCRLPPGYQLAVLPHDAVISASLRTGQDPDIQHPDPLPDFWESPNSVWIRNTVSSSYSLPKGIVAIAQVLYATTTLYRARGDQIAQYGYAAFGLTVIPYTLMSIVNLVGTLVTPEYPALYMLVSDVMAEASRRPGARFEGAVGSVCPAAAAAEEEEDVELFSGTFIAGEDGRMRWRRIRHAAALVSTGTQRDGQIQPNEVTPLDEAQQNGESQHGEEAPRDECPLRHEETQQDEGTQQNEETQRGGEAQQGEDTQPDEYIIVNDSRNTLRIPSCSNFARTNPFIPKGDGTDGYSRWLLTIIFIYSAIVISILGGLSHFRSANSTRAQRVWTMTWLAFGITVGCARDQQIAGYLGTFILLLIRTKNSLGRSWAIGASVIFTIISLMFGAPAVGGFVTVGQMVQAYGKCIRIS
jgi:hypothetical protein